MLEVGVRNDAGRLFAGLLADGVGAHAVGHEEQMAALPPLGVVGGELHGLVVLVVAAADAHVGQAGILDLVEAIHRKRPRTPRLRALAVCYTAAGVLHRDHSPESPPPRSRLLTANPGLWYTAALSRANRPVAPPAPPSKPGTRTGPAPAGCGT